MTEHSGALAGYVTPCSAATKGNERGNEVWGVKIPSCGTVTTGQTVLRKIYTVWMKIMDKERSRVWVYIHAQDHKVWNIYKGRHLEPVIVYNYFGHRVALTCFYNVRKKEVGSTKCS